MAFNSIAEPTIEEGMKSKFNEAFLKMHRLHKLQDSMNFCEMNLLAFNMEAMAYNYEIKIRCCNSLLMEVWGKLDEEERKEALRLKNAIKQFLVEHPVHKERVDKTNGKPVLRMNPKTFEILDNAIEGYECKIRELLSRTGYDTQNQEEWDEDTL